MMLKIQELKIESEIFDNSLYSIHMKAIRYWGFIISMEQKYAILRAYFVVFTIICVSILNFIKIIHSLNDLEGCAIGGATGFLFLSLSVLCVNVCIQRRRVVKLITFLHYDLKSLLSSFDDDATEEAELHSTIRFVRQVTIFLFAPSMTAAILFYTDCIYRAIFLPESVFNVPQVLNGSAQPVALHKAFPFGEVDDNFMIGFIFPFYAGGIAVAFVPLSHTFMICLMRYVILKFRIIQKRMRQMDVTRIYQRSIEDNHDNANILQYDLEHWQLELYKFGIDEQNKMRWFVKELEFFLRIPVFADFIICSILICFLFYAMTSGLLTKMDYIFMAIFMQVVLSILWLYHWHATLIAECNDDLRFALYSSDWYTCTLKVQKSLRLIMTDTLKPLQMRAFFIDMNLNTFIHIVRCAYGYFSILRNVSAN